LTKYIFGQPLLKVLLRRYCVLPTYKVCQSLDWLKNFTIRMHVDMHIFSARKIPSSGRSCVCACFVCVCVCVCVCVWVRERVCVWDAWNIHFEWRSHCRGPCRGSWEPVTAEKKTTLVMKYMRERESMHIVQCSPWTQDATRQQRIGSSSSSLQLLILRARARPCKAINFNSVLLHPSLPSPCIFSFCFPRTQLFPTLLPCGNTC
jgi:hypothetical protein